MKALDLKKNVRRNTRRKDRGPQGHRLTSTSKETEREGVKNLEEELTWQKSPELMVPKGAYESISGKRRLRTDRTLKIRGVYLRKGTS